MAITDKITAIADAIRSKTNTSRLLRMDEMPALITSIAGEGVAEYVNFYDYDGTLLHQYTVNEFALRNTMPPLPDNLDGSTCTGWNYDIETIHSLGCHVNVAAIYRGNDTTATIEENEPVTVDGTKLYLSFDKETTITFYYRQSKVNGVTIDWGDGNHYTNSSSGGSTNISTTHAYQKGDYILSFTLHDGATLSLGQNNTNYCVIGSCSINATTCPVLVSLKKAEIDTRNTILLTGAFRFCIGLKEVVIGSGTNRTIPTYAFSCCYALESLHISQSITQISDYAFTNCYRLFDVVIPNSVTTIGNYAFQECRRLYSVKIPGSVVTLNTSAFQNCTALGEVILGSGIKTISTNVFYGCSLLPSITLPNSITTINSQAFFGCIALKHITLPYGMTAISNGTFQGATALRSICLHEGIKSISDNAFNGCTSLAFVGFPKTLRTIGTSAFVNCYHLKNAVFAEGATTINSSAFQNTYALEYVSLPTTMTSVGSCAFQNCKALKNILLPPQLTTKTGFLVSCNMVSEKTAKVYKNLLAGCSSIQNNAFQSCQGLEEAEVPEGITTIGVSAFADNRGLADVTLPLGVTSIGNSCFANDGNIERLTFPRTLTTVGTSAFSSCVALKEADLPAVVTSIGNMAFQNCFRLEKVTLRRNGVAIPPQAFNHCHRLKTINFPSVVKKATITGDCFSYSGLRETPDFPEETNINEGSTFAYCYGLLKADLSHISNPTGTGMTNGFICCYALSELKLPQHLISIATSMMQQNYALAGKIDIPAQVWQVGSKAFYQCYNITDVNFLGSYIGSIGSEAFSYCYNLREAHIPQSVTTMSKCFNYCYGLRKIYMYPLTPPTGTATIGDLANDYTIYVPRGSLDAYKARFTSHSSRMEEFDYVMPTNKVQNRTVCISDTSLTIRNVLAHTELPENPTFTITYNYDGQNFANIYDVAYDPENNNLSFSFDRAVEFDFSAEETIGFHIQVNEINLGCDFLVTLKYREDDVRNEYYVVNISGYNFTEDSEGFYVSGNKGVHNSYSLCKIIFVSGTGKLYLDCNGQGESNFDYGMVSKLDVLLSSSSTADAATYLQKNFQGLGSYNQVVEFDIPDGEEHFITCKYRKDGSVNTGLDRFRFRVRFE